MLRLRGETYKDRMEHAPRHSLLEVSQDEMDKVRHFYNIDINAILQDLEVIEEWGKKQDHLVEAMKYLHREILERFYLIAKGSVEATKNMIEKLFTMRGMMSELALNKSIGEFNKLLENIKFIVMPKLTEELSRVTIIQFATGKWDDFNFQTFVRYYFMLADYRLHFDYNLSETFIVDLKNLGINDITRFNPMIIKKAEILSLGSYGVKINSIHLVNAPSFVDTLITIVKQALRENLVGRLHVHSTYDDLYKAISKDIIPEDYGGNSLSVAKLSGFTFIKKILSIYYDSTVPKYSLKKSLYQSTMESIPKGSILEFNPDTLQFLRQQYNLEKPGRIEEAIDLLEEWIKKQPHFRKKDFSRDYLERTIIISKGSVEKAKIKLDRICTYRTLYPHFFGVRDIRKSESLTYIRGAFMRKLTKEHYRTFVFKSDAKTYPIGLLQVYQYFFLQCEYIQAHDYCNGLVAVMDFNEANIMETLKAYNLTELRQGLHILKEGYGMRIKGLHLLSQSKAIDALVSLFKQVFSAKLASRVVVHKTMDTLYNHVPKEILPKEYGGNEKTLIELHNEFLDILTADEFLEYMNEINKATTNEDLRVLTDEDQALGVPGTFRALSVD